LLYDGPLLCGFNVAIKGLNSGQTTFSAYYWTFGYKTEKNIES